MNVTDILRIHEVKKTPGRIAIIKALQDSSNPLSESEIKESMQENYDRITFYRNIQTLSSAGIIHKIVVDNTLIRFGLNCSDAKHNHHIHRNEHAHFYCESCRAVVCLKQVIIPEFTLPSGYKNVDSDIIIRGKCEKCSQ